MINIAIDGPAGAGKSTLARQAAEKLGYIYVDTGALYRTIALFMLQRRIDPYDTQAVANVLPMVDVDIKHVNGEQRVYLCGENVSAVIRTPEISNAASIVAANPKVREFLADVQEDMAHNNNVIMDGRDIGTVVLPNAQVKIFLTASPEKRAERRYIELKEKGMDVDYEHILADVKQRDYQDSHRAIAPLRPADDAVLLDTTDCDLEQSLIRLLDIIDRRLKGGASGDDEVAFDNDDEF